MSFANLPRRWTWGPVRLSRLSSPPIAVAILVAR